MCAYSQAAQPRLYIWETAASTLPPHIGPDRWNGGRALKEARHEDLVDVQGVGSKEAENVRFPLLLLLSGVDLVSQDPALVVQR